MRRRALLALAGTSLPILAGCLGTTGGHQPVQIGEIRVESAVPAAQTATVEVDDEETTVYEQTVSLPASTEHLQIKQLSGYPTGPGLYTIRCTFEQRSEWIKEDDEAESESETRKASTGRAYQRHAYQRPSHQQGGDEGHTAVNSSAVAVDYTETSDNQDCYNFYPSLRTFSSSPDAVMFTNVCDDGDGDED